MHQCCHQTAGHISDGSPRPVVSLTHLLLAYLFVGIRARRAVGDNSQWSIWPAVNAGKTLGCMMLLAGRRVPRSTTANGIRSASVRAWRKGQGSSKVHVPYQDHKLTQLLKQSFTLREACTIVIATMSCIKCGHRTCVEDFAPLSV